MANSDDVRFKGSGKEYKDDRGGATLIPSAVVGIVKNNIDPTRSGRLDVYVKRLGSSNPDNPAYWTTVRYLSPFFGSTPNTSNPEAHGEYVGNPNSYGFWATPPDIGTEVVCVFLNGDPNEGYYIGSIPRPGLTHMTPGLAASDSIIPNKGEAESYGGATRLPVSEINNANDKQNNNLTLSYQPRPIHSYQAAIYNKQGLLRDPDRGPISSSSVRESPSRVFGMSTPGRPIYQGGYDDSSIAKAISDSSVPDKNFQIIGRTGGHSFVMDDGDIIGKDQLIRLRTSTGHTILMNDAAQTLFIIHANGQSYIELGKEGTIDMYSTNSVNIRTQGDLNLHADRNININAGKDLNINAENVQVESEKATNMFTGTDFSQSVKGNFTNKVDGSMSIASSGAASLASSGTTYINGPSAVNLNTGSSSLVPKDVKQVTKVKHTDTLYDSKKGFAAAPGTLSSITSRAPAHSPWADAGKGVNAKTNLSASANFAPAASPAVAAANSAAPAAPTQTTSPTVATTVPVTATASTNMSKATTSALTSQMAVNAATGPAADAVKATAGTVTTNGTATAVLGATALTPDQLAIAGYIKPGIETAINAAIASGKSLSDAIPPTAWTGKDGVNSLADYLKSQNVQVSATQELLSKSKDSLVKTGVLTGKESETQSGGLILAAASAGVGAVTDFMKKVATTGTAAFNSVASVFKSNPTVGSVTNLIAGGKMAAGMADKVMGGLNVPGIPDSATSAAKGLFDKITSSFKSLTAGVPQNLTAINAKNKAEEDVANTKPADSASTGLLAAAKSAASKVGETISSTNIMSTLESAFKNNQQAILNQPQLGTIAAATGLGLKITQSISKSMTSGVASGVDNLPGGGSSVSNIVKGDLPQSVPGTSLIKSSLASISSAASGMIDSTAGVVNGLKDKLSGASLSAFASLGLNQADLAKLNGAINSVSAGGADQIKLPTVAEATNNVSELVAQSKNLLGNPKIPSLSFGSDSSTSSSTMLSISQARRAAADKVKEAQKAYEESLASTGNRSDPATATAFAEYKQALADMDKVG